MKIRLRCARSVAPLRPARRDGLGKRLYVLACLAGVLGSLCLLTGSTAVEAQEGYSAYEDADKPVAAFVLSQGENAEEFRETFGLDAGEMEGVLAAVRAENAALARVRAGGTTVSAADYNERVGEVVAETKKGIEAPIPEDERVRLARWMDARFAREGREAAASSVVEGGFMATRARAIRCKVFATYYGARTRDEVALPHRSLQGRERHRRIRIWPVYGGRRAKAFVKDTGPWNTRDNYWQSRRERSKWRKLPRCVPQAQAAYFRNFNRGRDENGRVVTNPAGIDITLGVAGRMGIKKRMQRKGVVRVQVRYPWVQR